MITLIVDNFKSFSQKNYDSIIDSLDLHRIQCSCKNTGCLIRHGHYCRSVITEEGKRPFRIQRVYCTECGKTHAILLASIVPYSQISLEDHRRVIQAYESGGDINAPCSGDGIDENNVKSIILRYRRFWQQRLLSEGIKLEPVHELIRACFSFFRMQFMQIHRTRNILFPLPT